MKKTRAKKLKMADFDKEYKVPIRIILRPKSDNGGFFAPVVFRFVFSAFKKSLVFGVIVLTVLGQASLFSAFESHVINVTASICKYSEIRSMGYWKNHQYIYAHYLPQNLGDEVIDTINKVENVFDADNSAMRNKLKKQLLAMKFNIAHFGIGEYLVESDGKTLNQLVAEADDLLRQSPQPSDSVLEEMKNLLDYLNNLEQLKFCKANVPDYNYPVINEVYYDVGNRKFCAIDKEEEPRNEWIELYNPTDNSVDVSGWIIEDNNSSDIIPASPPIPPHGFAVIAKDATTWQFWSIPPEAVKIELGSVIGNGLNNDGDRVILKNSSGVEIDAVSYGTDVYAFDPSVSDVSEGHSIARSPKGFDTNMASDWVDLETPNPGTNPHYEGHNDGTPCFGGGAAKTATKVIVGENEEKMDEAEITEIKEDSAPGRESGETEVEKEIIGEEADNADGSDVDKEIADEAVIIEEPIIEESVTESIIKEDSAPDENIDDTEVKEEESADPVIEESKNDSDSPPVDAPVNVDEPANI